MQSIDTMLILSRYKGSLPVPIVQFCFNISQTAVDHLPYPTPSFWTSILLSNLGTLHKSTRQLNYCRVLWKTVASMVGLQSMWVDGCCGAKANKQRPPSKIADEWARNWVNRKFNILRWQPTKVSLVHTIPLIVLRSSTNLLQLTTAEWRVHIGVTWRWIGSFNLPTTNLFEDELCFTCNTIIQYG